MVDDPLNLQNSRFFSLIDGNLATETSSIRTASTATNWVSVLSRVFDFSALQILPLVQGLCANRAMTVFTQRRIRAAFAAIAARASRLRILVVRQSLPSKPNSRWANETENERHW